MSTKSRTCTGAVSKAPLTEYASEDEACAGADYAFERHGSAMVPYLCDRCHCWHLSPHDRQTRASTCTACVGRDGRPKARYDSKEAAVRRLEILRQERHVSLRVYPCPHGGWHLTKA
jgi:hypothetical protein